MNSNDSESPKSNLLRRLRIAVGKLQFLFRNLTPQYSSINLIDRRPSGLIEICDDTEEYSPLGRSDLYASASAGSTQGRVLHRTTSVAESSGCNCGGEEDVDRKADAFIQNFYRQLRLEKQISLELRYRRDYSFGSSTDPSP